MIGLIDFGLNSSTALIDLTDLIDLMCVIDLVGSIDWLDWIDLIDVVDLAGLIDLLDLIDLFWFRLTDSIDMIGWEIRLVDDWFCLLLLGSFDLIDWTDLIGSSCWIALIDLTDLIDWTDLIDLAGLVDFSLI